MEWDERMKVRAEVFKTAVLAHAQSERPYMANVHEHCTHVIATFDRLFPKETTANLKERTNG